MAVAAALASILMAVALVFLLALSGGVAAYAAYAIYAVGNLAASGQLLTAHTVVATSATVAIFLVITLAVVFVSSVAARGFDFATTEEAEGREALAWTPAASADFSKDLLHSSRAKGSLKFFGAVTAMIAAFAIVAFGLCLEGWIAIRASKVKSAAANTAQWATVAAAVLFFLTFALFLGGIFLYFKYAKAAGAGVEALIKVYSDKVAESAS